MCQSTEYLIRLTIFTFCNDDNGMNLLIYYFLVSFEFVATAIDNDKLFKNRKLEQTSINRFMWLITSHIFSLTTVYHVWQFSLQFKSSKTTRAHIHLCCYLSHGNDTESSTWKLCRKQTCIDRMSSLFCFDKIVSLSNCESNHGESVHKRLSNWWLILHELAESNSIQFSEDWF